MTEVPPEAPPEPPAAGFEFNQPTIVALCYLASAVTGFPVLIGVVLAYIWQGAPEQPWEASHFRFHIRSFWIGIALGLLFVIPTVMTLGLAGFILYPLLMLWVIIRTATALIKAQRRQPISNVETWAW
jgi:uncharacterized membrane protein